MSPRDLLNLTRLGWGVAIPVLFLATIGLTCIHVTDRNAPPDPAIGDVSDEGGAGWMLSLYRSIGPLTTKQIIYMITGVGLMLLMMWPSYQKLGRYAYPFYGLAVCLLALLVLGQLLDRFGGHSLPLVPAARGVRRWVGYGTFRIQPSEFAKLALILALARYLRFRDSYRTWAGLLPPFLLTLVPMFMILFQPDLGTLLMLLPVLFSMLFVAGARLRHLLLIMVLGGAVLPLFYTYGMKDYQKTRIEVLFRQGSKDESWHMDQGYQLRQSKIALGTGGLYGSGFGEGIFVRNDGLLPEEHNDFIFAIVGHQWGFVGCVLVILAYGAIVLFGLEVALVTNDPFGRLLAVGVVVMIAAQALLNISMTIGLAPSSGMPLPFVSAGGSSLWANFLALGLLLNVAQRRPLLIAHPPFEYGDQ